MNISDALKKLKNAQAWPEAFKKGAPIWDDEYISSNMLKAHLDESHDKASYKKELRQKIVKNIMKKCGLKQGDSILDLGCGPGLYAKEFAQHGIKYTGIDISRQSLGYAMTHKGEYAELISYIQGDYTLHEFSEKYDCITMIWCDFGALSPADRDNMLKNVIGALKDGASFMFDVYSTSSPFEKETNRWRIEHAGFWNAGEYLLMERSKFYEAQGAALYEAFVVTEGDVQEYRIWDKRYNKDELIYALKNAGFSSVKIKKGGLSTAQREMFGVIAKK